MAKELLSNLPPGAWPVAVDHLLDQFGEAWVWDRGLDGHAQAATPSRFRYFIRCPRVQRGLEARLGSRSAMAGSPLRRVTAFRSDVLRELFHFLSKDPETALLHYTNVLPSRRLLFPACWPVGEHPTFRVGGEGGGSRCWAWHPRLEGLAEEMTGGQVICPCLPVRLRGPGNPAYLRAQAYLRDRMIQGLLLLSPEEVYPTEEDAQHARTAWLSGRTSENPEQNP